MSDKEIKWNRFFDEKTSEFKNHEAEVEFWKENYRDAVREVDKIDAKADANVFALKCSLGVSMFVFLCFFILTLFSIK